MPESGEVRQGKLWWCICASELQMWAGFTIGPMCLSELGVLAFPGGHWEYGSQWLPCVTSLVRKLSGVGAGLAQETCGWADHWPHHSQLLWAWSSSCVTVTWCMSRVGLMWGIASWRAAAVCVCGASMVGGSRLPTNQSHITYIHRGRLPFWNKRFRRGGQLKAQKMDREVGCYLGVGGETPIHQLGKVVDSDRHPKRKDLKRQWGKCARQSSRQGHPGGGRGQPWVEGRRTGTCHSREDVGQPAPTSVPQSSHSTVMRKIPSFAQPTEAWGWAWLISLFV